ncbi:CBO0543 family protein [Salibacterium aidingense]|uniref:CBO0543 family protein n=1 Tax=Salibacterium aidingense TaxID=384933 RepID=UPI003BB9C71B
MAIEHIIELSTCATMVVLLLIFVPKNKIRESTVIFLFKQFMTWPLGLYVVHKNWIEYPSRLFFQNSSGASFTFEYLLYPALCVLFVLYYPSYKKWIIKFLYFITYCSAITFIEALLEIYTNTVQYNEWTWYWTWLSLLVTFFISLKFYSWFFKIR